MLSLLPKLATSIVFYETVPLQESKARQRYGTYALTFRWRADSLGMRGEVTQKPEKSSAGVKSGESEKSSGGWQAGVFVFLGRSYNIFFYQMDGSGHRVLLEKGSVGNYERSVYRVSPILTISVVGPSSRRLERSYPQSASSRNRTSSAQSLLSLEIRYSCPFHITGYLDVVVIFGHARRGVVAVVRYMPAESVGQCEQQRPHVCPLKTLVKFSFGSRRS